MNTNITPAMMLPEVLNIVVWVSFSAGFSLQQNPLEVLL
jgi:hypothetical protein